MTSPPRCGAPCLYEVSSGLALELWPLLERHIERAAAHHPFLDAEGLKGLVACGAATIFIATTASGVMGFAACEVLQYPRQNVANVLFAGGDRGFLEPLLGALLEKMEAWGRQRGATHLSMAGRPGWLRVLKARNGWTVSAQAFAHRELADHGIEGRAFADPARDRPD